MSRPPLSTERRTRGPGLLSVARCVRAPGLPFVARRARALGLPFVALAVVARCAGAQPLPDNVVPAAIDAALAAPGDPLLYGIPNHAPGVLIASVQGTPSSRCVVSIGDATGDGAEDFAVGFAPGSAPHTLQARDGRSAAVLWGASPDGGGFRGLRTLAFAGGTLFAAASSHHGRVERRDPASGAALWSRDLTAGGDRPVNLLALEPLADVDGDGAIDVLVAGGLGLDALLLLSGADGSTLWTHAAGDAVCDVRATADADGDGVPEVLCCGGDAVPFARLLSGATGAALWSAGLPGTGSAILPLPDIGADGTPDVAVGAFAAPDPCVFALDGATGALQWTSVYATDDVTAFTPLGDIDADGFLDFAVGSFDNALTLVSSLDGIFQWRREGSTINGGSMLAAPAVIGDVNGNGAPDLLTASLDTHAYIFDGKKGFYIGTQELRSRGVATASLGDADGDGRMEMVACGSSSLFVLDGTSGAAVGPVCYLKVPATLSSEYAVYSFGYPSVPLLVFGAPATGSLKLPGFSGSFGLSPSSFQLMFAGTMPAAGLTGHVFPPLPREAVGLTLHFQTVTVFAPGHGGFSNVASFTVPP